MSSVTDANDDPDEDGISTTDGPRGVTTITKSAGGVTKTVTAGPDGVKTVIDNGHGQSRTVTISPDGVHSSDGGAFATTRDEAASVPTHYWSRDGGFHSWMGIIVLVILASIIRTAIRAKHGDFRSNRQRRRDERAGIVGPPGLTPTREAELLAEENVQLRAQATRLEERVRVLERIVTDPAKRVSDEIDALR